MRAKTINFDEEVISYIESMASAKGLNVSYLVNATVRRHLFGDEVFHRERAKQAMMDYHEHVYLAERVRAMIELKV